MKSLRGVCCEEKDREGSAGDKSDQEESVVETRAGGEWRVLLLFFFFFFFEESVESDECDAEESDAEEMAIEERVGTGQNREQKEFSPEFVEA